MRFMPAFVLFASTAGVLAFIEAGRRIGLRISRRSGGPRQVLQAVEASVFALMGLITAFIFYGAGARFEARRGLIAEEANAIGTAYLRLDLLPPETQPEIRKEFREYVRSRLAVYHDIAQFKAVRAALDRSSALQRRVWTSAVAASNSSGPAERSLVLSAINEMIDITTVRTVALYTHPPAAVFALLAVTVIASSALAGYTMVASEARDWVSLIAFVVVVGAALYVILDYEYPRIGIIRIDAADEVLRQTLENMK